MQLAPLILLNKTPEIMKFPHVATVLLLLQPVLLHLLC
jgi:hypothetical protein